MRGKQEAEEMLQDLRARLKTGAHALIQDPDAEYQAYARQWVYRYKQQKPETCSPSKWL